VAFAKIRRYTLDKVKAQLPP